MDCRKLSADIGRQIEELAAYAAGLEAVLLQAAALYARGKIERGLRRKARHLITQAAAMITIRTVALGYGLDDFAVPYSPIHSKYCIVDGYLVLEGSFNWYNASVFSHDIVIIAANKKVADPYLFEFDQILRRLRIIW